MPRDRGRLAVALHGIEPGTFEHCVLIREWLADLGVTRVTLCVIPAADHHPFFRRSPALTEWLHERRRRGDAIAQQGLVAGRGPAPRDAGAHVRSGRRLLVQAGLEPTGYLAPSLPHAVGAWYDLATTFDWWIAAGWLRLGSPRSASTLRVDVHPRDFDRGAGRTRAMERSLRRAAADRSVVTYDDLVTDTAEVPAYGRVQPR